MDQILADAIAFAAGIGVTVPLVVSNRRRIKRLERRLRAHEVVIRDLAASSMDPEPPPIRRRPRAFKGAAAVGALAMLARQHPARAALAASGTAAVATVLAVALTPMQAPGGPAAGGLQAPGSPAVAYSAPTVTPGSPVPSPSVSASQAAPTSAMPAPGTSGTSAPSADPASSQPLLMVSLPPIRATVSLPPVTMPPPPTGSLLPTIPVTLHPTAPSRPSGKTSSTCVVDLTLPPLLRACLPGNGK